MKFSKLNKLAGAFFALVLGTSTLFSQGRQYRYMWENNVQQKTCINQPDGLSDQQKKTIDELRDKHFSAMAELHDKRQSATETEVKTSIRDEMLESILSFRKAVYNVLNPEQQKQFDLIHLKKEFSKKGNSGMNFCMENSPSRGNGICKRNRNFNGNNGANHRGRFRQGYCKSL
jgi:hypothetical protein